MAARNVRRSIALAGKPGPRGPGSAIGFCNASFAAGASTAPIFASRLSQNLIATLIDMATTEHDRLGFIFGEHERRQKQTGPQHVTDPRLAIDGSALGA